MLIVKEILYLLRNSGTWWTYLSALLIPFGCFYLLFQFSGEIIKNQMDDGAKKVYKVAWVAEGNDAKVLYDRLDLHLQVNLVDDYDLMDLKSAIEKDSIQAAIIIGANFDTLIAQQKTASIQLHYQGNSRAVGIVEGQIRSYKKELLNRNIENLDLSKDLLEPISLREQNYFNAMDMLDDIFLAMRKSVALLLALIMLIFGLIAARFAMKVSFWREEALHPLLKRMKMAPSRLFGVKLLCMTVFVWENMLLAVLGFAMALGIEQGGLIQNLLVEFQSLLPWSRVLWLMIVALPFAFLMSSSYLFLGLWGQGWKRLLFYSFTFVLVVLFLISGALNLSGNALMACLPFIQAPILLMEMLNEQTSWLHWILAICSMSLFGAGFAFVASLRYQLSGR